MSKRIISLILCLLITISCFSVSLVSAGAEDGVAKITLNGNEYIASVGDTITFTAMCASPQKLSGMAGKLYYDTAMLDGVSCADFIAFKQPYYDCYPVLSKNNLNIAGGDDEQGVYAFAAFAPTNSDYFDFTSAATICTFNFTVICAGQSEIVFDLSEAFYPSDDITDYDYIENNSLTPDVATTPQKTITAGGTIKDKLTDDYLKLSCTLTGATPTTDVKTENLNLVEDVDLFCVKTTDAGRLNLYFKHTAVDKSGAWKVTVKKKTGENLEFITSKTIKLTDSEKVTIPFVGAVAGGEYYIYVESADKGKSIAKRTYTIETTFSKSSAYEKEYNNTSANATKIDVNKSYSGVIGYSSDYDWYKVTAPCDGKLSVLFDYTRSNVSDKWVVTLYKSTDGKLSRVSSKTISAKSSTEAKFSTVTVKNGDLYYIKVDDNSSYDAIGRTYKLNAGFSLASMSGLKATPYKTSVKLTWKKSSSNKFQVQYKKSGSYTTLKKTSLLYYTKKSLSKGKTYYFRVRTYKVVGDTTYYGAWKTISAKTLK